MMLRWWRQCHPHINRQCTFSTSTKPSPLSDGWESVVGLEIHAQIVSQSKLFCRSRINPSASPNTCIGVYDTGHPGTMPTLNRRCVEAALLTAQAFDARISRVAHFDRKHYFYPDMPTGYQVTQQRAPIARDGCIEFVVQDGPGGYVHSAHLERIQLEEDSGKCIYDNENNKVLVDHNRCGVGLLELVFAPCLDSAAQAAGLVTRVVEVLRELGVCSGKMNEGALRVDANVSVNRAGEPRGVRTEIKNINSIKYTSIAINSELARQVALLSAGGHVINETRRYDSVNRATHAMRDKEGLQDYRFIPEPNLPPLRTYDSAGGSPPPLGASPHCIDVSTLPPLPPYPRVCANSFERLTKAGLGPLQAAKIMANAELEAKFHEVLGHEPRDTADLCAALLLHCHGALPGVQEWLASSDVLRRVVELQRDGLLKVDTADLLGVEMIRGAGGTVEEIAASHHWLLTADVGLILAAVEHVMLAAPDVVTTYHRRAANPKKRLRPLAKLVKMTLVRLPSDTDPARVEQEVLRWLEGGESK